MALIFLLGAPAGQSETNSSGLVINEIMYDAEGKDDNKEWLEVKNLTGEEFDLSDLKIIDHKGNHPLPKEISKLPPNGFFIFAHNAEQFLLDYPNIECLVIDGTLDLLNNGETIKIVKKTEEVFSLTYSSADGGAGDGKTLERKEKDGLFVLQASQEKGGTPGRENSLWQEVLPPAEEEPTEETPGTAPPAETDPESFAPLKADIGPDITALVGQKIAFDTKLCAGQVKYIFWNFGDGASLTGKETTEHAYLFPGKYLASLTVGDGAAELTDFRAVTILAGEIEISEFLAQAPEADAENEWIELFNNSASPVFLDGWMLDDEEKGSSPFVFPKNSLIPEKSYLVLSRQTTKIALNNDGDAVRLLLPDKEVFQEIKYEKAAKGKCASIFKDQDFYWTDFCTPGQTNFPPDDPASEKETEEKISLSALNVQEVKTKTQGLLKKLNLIPAVRAAQVKATDPFGESWLGASQILREQPSLSTGLPVENQTEKKQGELKENFSSPPAGQSKNESLLFGVLSNRHRPLVILLVSLAASLALFGWWITLLFKKSKNTPAS